MRVARAVRRLAAPTWPCFPVWCSAAALKTCSKPVGGCSVGGCSEHLEHVFLAAAVLGVASSRGGLGRGLVAWGATVRGTYGTPVAGTRTQYVQYAGPWRQAALRLRYVPNAGGWYA